MQSEALSHPSSSSLLSEQFENYSVKLEHNTAALYMVQASVKATMAKMKASSLSMLSTIFQSISDEANILYVFRK